MFKSGRVRFKAQAVNAKQASSKRINADADGTSTAQSQADCDALTQAERQSLCAKWANQAPPSTQKGLGQVLDYFSSHPDTAERLEKFRLSLSRVDPQ